MKTIILAAALLAGTSAFAQTSTGDASMGANWSSSSRSVFFGDDNMTLRTQDEAKTKWSSLSQEDKDKIKQDCQTFDASASGSSTSGSDSSTSGTASTGSDSSGTTSGTSGSTDSSTSSSGTSGTSGSDTSSTTASGTSSDASMPITSANMKSICDMVKMF